MRTRPILLVVSTPFSCAGRAPALYPYASQSHSFSTRKISSDGYRTIRYASSAAATATAKKSKKTAPITTTKSHAANKKQQSAGKSAPGKTPHGKPILQEPPRAKSVAGIGKPGPGKTTHAIPTAPGPPTSKSTADVGRIVPAPPGRASDDSTVNSNKKLNPPPETYAPPLEVPSRQPNQNYFRYLFTAGKAYITFYKTGMRNLWELRGVSKKLRERQRNAMNGVKAGEPVVDISDIVLTRAEWQVVRRNRADVARGCVFLPILIVFGEWTPFLVPFLMPIVPETCRLPSQVRKYFEKGEARRVERQRVAARYRKLGTLFAGSEVEAKLSAGGLQPEMVRVMEKGELLGLAGRLDVYSGVWEYFMTPPLFYIRRALKKKLEYLRTDDGLIERDGGWMELGSQELKRACWERGMFVVGKNEQDMMKWMKRWFAADQGAQEDGKSEKKQIPE